MPQKWPVGWSDCLSILTVLNACNVSVEPSASHELRLFLICYPPNFAQNLGMSHNDIYVLIEAAKIIHDLDGEVVIAPYDLALEGTGEVAEFCIGGPESNQRGSVGIPAQRPLFSGGGRSAQTSHIPPNQA